LISPQTYADEASRYQHNERKRQPLIDTSVDLDAPVNISIIQDLIEEESYRARSKLSMEAITSLNKACIKFQEQNHVMLDAPLSGSAALV
jgi:hypothetical protein